MSQQSPYPSPVSSRGSPQNNLRQASAVLEDAYNRLRQVRRTFLELSETSTTLDTPLNQTIQSHTTRDIGPGHNAIMLTDSSHDGSNSLEPSLPPLSLVQLNAYEMSSARDYDMVGMNADRTGGDQWNPGQSPVLGPTETLPSISHQIPPNIISPVALNSPVSPIRNPLPRRSMLEPQLSRTWESDDPSTALGRRVAAREVGSTASAHINRMDRITRDIIALSNSYRQRARHTDPLPDLLSGEPILEYPRPSAAEIRARRSLDANVLRAVVQSNVNPIPGHAVQVNVPGPSNTLYPPRLNLNDRRRTSRAEIRQSSAQSPASSRSDTTRLSILSNFSINNITTPVSNGSRERPLLFEEPTSYDLPARRDSAEFEITRTRPDSRSYLVRRQVNADGQEYVHHITLDSDEEESELMYPPPRPRPLPPRARVPQRLPSIDPRYAAEPVQGTAPPQRTRRSAPMDMPLGQRRAWARLDPDGNEIPLIEEYELERARTETRVRALLQARLGVDQGDIAAARGDLYTIHSAAAARNEDDSSPYEDYGDVDGELYHYSQHQHIPSSFDFSSSSFEPFKPDPLPMPLEEMTSQPYTQKRSQTMIVPKHPVIAGR